MIVHHEKEIKKVLRNNKHGLSRKQVFQQAFSNTKGAARHNKLEKAWNKLRSKGEIVKTPGKRYLGKRRK